VIRHEPGSGDVQQSLKQKADGGHGIATHDVARRAYELSLARDREDGHDLDDWLQAERELLQTEGE
jgi:hypothetical protein